MSRVYWHLSDYISHRKAGQAYRRCIQLAGHVLVDQPDRAELVVIHDDPLFWPGIVASLPLARTTPLVGYAVWEGAALPEIYRPGLAMVSQVWTASSFSAAALSQGHHRVRVLPHVVEAVEPTAEDLAWVKAQVGSGPYFLTIMDAVNPRKNLEALLRVFARVRAGVGTDLRLVIKQYRQEVPLPGLSGVHVLIGNLSETRMAALHHGCLAYVGPHRGEAWGMGLSEAMSHGAIVLATGWSGNMDFMDSRNSVPLDYVLEPVGNRMAGMLPHFHPDMLWARVEEGHLEREMLRVARRGPDRAMALRAMAVRERFGPVRVARILSDLVSRVVDAGVSPRL